MMTNLTGLTIIIFAIAHMDGIMCTCLDGSRFEMINTSYTDINNESFSKCIFVLHVNMSGNKFTKVETYSFSTIRLTKDMDLSNNQIQLIETEAFSNMFSLEDLYLYHNQLVDIPLDFFRNKEQLISVDLSYNKIKHIPLTVFSKFSLPNIDRVSLHHNRILAFEPWAYTRNPIRFANVSHNIISTFTNEYNWTYDKRSVDKERGCMDKWWSDDFSIQTWCISSEAFASNTVKNMQQCEISDFEREKTKVRQVEYEKTKKVTTDLRYNNITEWHDWYILQYKEQTRNGFDDIQTVIIELLLDIRENSLTCDCNIYKLVKKVRGSFVQWSGHDYLKLVCYNPPNLRGKLVFYDVSYREFLCVISDDCPIGCKCEDRPAENSLDIDCSHLNLKKMPSTLPRSPYDNIVLHLDNNKITNISDVYYLKYVSKLVMSNNSVTNLPDYVINNVAKNKNSFLDFRNNDLTVIPKSAEKIKFQDALFEGNNLECSCDMIWMVDWIKEAPSYTDKNILRCTFEGDTFTIIKLDKSILKCQPINIILIVMLSLMLGIVILLMITTKRCSYETKVILFKVFRIHFFDRYVVDENTDKCYDMYVSFDDNDFYVRQWVMKALLKQLECKNPYYKLSIYARNAPTGPETEARFQLIDKSKRILFILSSEYEKHKWFDYEMCHSETLEQNNGRIIYLLYDEHAERKAIKEPWLSKMKERKVFKMTDKLF